MKLFERVSNKKMWCPPGVQHARIPSPRESANNRALVGPLPEGEGIAAIVALRNQAGCVWPFQTQMDLYCGREAKQVRSRGTLKGEESFMAKYGKKAASKVKRAMHERKHGTLKSGRSGKKVTSRKQAIAIGLSEARKAGAKVPKKKSSKKKK
jgi:hypothetical protein